jgi:hypothetical protein
LSAWMTRDGADTRVAFGTLCLAAGDDDILSNV